jgi:hypothetical protein
LHVVLLPLLFFAVLQKEPKKKTWPAPAFSLLTVDVYSKAHAPAQRANFFHIVSLKSIFSTKTWDHQNQ